MTLKLNHINADKIFQENLSGNSNDNMPCTSHVSNIKKEEILKHFYAQVTICKFFEISPAIKQVLLMSTLVEKSSGLYTKVSAV